MEQRITVTHLNGEPLDAQAIYVERQGGPLAGTRYRLTHYEREDARIVWVHGFREVDGIRHYVSLTPNEVTEHSLSCL